jgi:hypothetical protein
MDLVEVETDPVGPVLARIGRARMAKVGEGGGWECKTVIVPHDRVQKAPFHGENRAETERERKVQLILDGPPLRGGLAASTGSSLASQTVMASAVVQAPSGEYIFSFVALSHLPSFFP